MTDTVTNFLAPRLPIGGLAAYSIHLGDRVLDVQCFSKSLYSTGTEEMLSRVVQSGRNLLAPDKRAAQYCWTFEVHRVYVAARPDGVSLAFLVENRPGTELARVLETLQGFLSLAEL